MPASNPLPASTPQPLPRNRRMIPPKEKIHPAVKAGIDNFMATHGGKFAQNAGRGFKRGRE